MEGRKLIGDFAHGFDYVPAEEVYRLRAGYGDAEKDTNELDKESDVEAIIDKAIICDTLAKLVTTAPYSVVASIKNVIFNPPATIVFWDNGTKTVVKSHGEQFDPEKGLAMAIIKHIVGEDNHYYTFIKKWTQSYHDKVAEEAANLIEEANSADIDLRKGMYITLTHNNCCRNLGGFYEMVARKMGYPVTAKTEYNCRKIRVTKPVQDCFYEYYLNSCTTEEISTMLLMYGPKADLEPDGSQYKYRCYVEPGFVTEAE